MRCRRWRPEGCRDLVAAVEAVPAAAAAEGEGGSGGGAARGRTGVSAPVGGRRRLGRAEGVLGDDGVFVFFGGRRCWLLFFGWLICEF